MLAERGVLSDSALFCAGTMVPWLADRFSGGLRGEGRLAEPAATEPSCMLDKTGFVTP